jgi:hypothetical protein
MTLQDRNQQIANRIKNLTPLEEPLRQLFVDGKRDQLLHGQDAQGAPFAPLAPSTLRDRPGNGPPLAPMGDRSRIVVDYEVKVSTAAGQLTVSAGWPLLNWIKYHKTGTRKMPRRDPTGFRPADVADAMRRLREYLFNDH